MSILREQRVEVTSINVGRADCRVHLHANGAEWALNISMPPDEAARFRIGQQYLVRLCEAEERLEPPTIDNEERAP